MNSQGSPADRKADPAPHPWVAQVRNTTYKRIATGTWFVCAGAILLLNTLDRLSWGVWIDLARLWPLLLISLGLRWTFVRTPLHPLVLLGPLLVIGGAGLVVWGSLSHQTGVPMFWNRKGEEKTVAISCQGGGVSRLNLGFDAGRVSLTSDGGGGEESSIGSIRYVGDEPSRSCSGSTLRLGSKSGSDRVRIISPFNLGARKWDARVAIRGPLSVDAHIAGAAADLDLTGYDLRDLSLSAAGSDVAMRLGTPSGKVGIDLIGGLSSIRIVVPEGTCYSLTRRRRSNFVTLEGKRAGRARQVTAAACTGAKDAPRYAIDVDLPLASVRVESTPGTQASGPH